MRTREEQINDLVEALWDGMCRKDAEKSASMIIDEAMALGAAEQRRKNAEGQEPVAWTWKHIHVGVGWKREFDIENPQRYLDSIQEIKPLYDRPANVAALEARIAELKESEQLAWDYAEASKARVKVLEEALLSAVSALEQVTEGERGGYNARNGKFVSLQMSDGERADIIHSDVTTECEGALETARAALTREGGV